MLWSIILGKSGHFTVAVKDNQPGLKEVITRTFDNNKDTINKVEFNDCDYYIFPIDYELTEVEFPGTRAFIKMISHKRKDQVDYNPEPQYLYPHLIINNSSWKPLIIAGILKVVTTGGKTIS